VNLQGIPCVGDIEWRGDFFPVSQSNSVKTNTILHYMGSRLGTIWICLGRIFAYGIPQQDNVCHEQNKKHPWLWFLNRDVFTVRELSFLCQLPVEHHLDPFIYHLLQLEKAFEQKRNNNRKCFALEQKKTILALSQRKTKQRVLQWKIGSRGEWKVGATKGKKDKTVTTSTSVCHHTTVHSFTCSLLRSCCHCRHCCCLFSSYMHTSLYMLTA